MPEARPMCSGVAQPWARPDAHPRPRPPAHDIAALGAGHESTEKRTCGAHTRTHTTLGEVPLCWRNAPPPPTLIV